MNRLAKVALLVTLASAAAFGQAANNQCTKETDQQTTSGLSGTLTFPDSCGMRVNSWEMIVAGGPATNSVTISCVMRGGTSQSLLTSNNTLNSIFTTVGGPCDKYTFAWTMTGGSTPTLTINRTGSVTPTSSPSPFTGAAPSQCSGNQTFVNTTTGALYSCAGGVPSLLTGGTAMTGLTGGVQGETVVCNNSSGCGASPRSIDAAFYCPSASFSAGKCTSGDVCQAINAAATAAASLSGEVDARAFYGKQTCAAANATLMLNPLGNGGHVYLGNIHLYINGPCAHTPCTQVVADQTNFSFNDGFGAGATPGTPAILIPPRVILEGTIPRSDGANGTNIEVCQGSGNPTGSGCTIGFPQRSYPVSTVTCLSGTIQQQHLCTVNLTVASGTSCGSLANCAPNSGVAISTRDCGAVNPTFGWIAGATTHSNNFAGTVSGCAAAAVNLQAAVDDSVINTSLACATGCGTFYLPTPIVGFMNGDQGTVAYVNSNTGASVCYGCYLKNIALTSGDLPTSGSNYEGTVAFEDLFGQERSGGDHDSGTQGAWCLVIRGPQSQNGGPFDVGECNAGGFTSCEGHGFAWLQGAGAIRGLRGVTYNAGTATSCNSQAEQSNAMIVFDGQGLVLDTMYLSGGFDGILVGSQKASAGLKVVNEYCGAGGTATACQGNALALSAAFSPTDIGASGISVQNATFLNALKNYVTGCATGADAQVETYRYDNNGAGKIQEISTSELCPNQSGAGWKENVVSFGNLPACSATFEGVSAVANNCNAACTAGNVGCTGGGATHCQMRCNGTSWIETGR